LNKLRRVLDEYRALAHVLDYGNFLSLVMATAVNSGDILRTGKLTSVDAAMSRNMTVHFGEVRLVLPLFDIDQHLRARNDNPTFGNVRELYARNCYLQRIRLTKPQRTVLDLGANRGMFSLLALLALEADLVVGVEPILDYTTIFERLLEANHCDPHRVPRYTRFISSPSAERNDPIRHVSIQTILREQNIHRVDLVKMDIEGDEKVVFSEPEWLANVDNISMELHPQIVGDLSIIPEALRRYGFEYALTDRDGNGNLRGVDSANFLFASRIGAVRTNGA
jgi:Methyltransferase FkbM domain